MKYKPRDIKPPREINAGLVPGPFNQVYTNTLGGAEYETLAQEIVFRSQGWGEWTAVSDRLLAAVLTEGRDMRPDEALEYARAHLERGVDDGVFEREGREYRLTEAAIERLVERYPAQRTT
jgi:hypothetical protein